MKFVDDLKAYKAQREQAIQNKKDLLKQLKVNYANKLDQVAEAETKYKVNFDDKVFEKLAALKNEVQEIKANIDKIELQVSLMDVGQLTLNNDDITVQINEYVNAAKLDKLKENILRAKANYLAAIENFAAKTKEIEAVRLEIDNMGNIIDQNNKKPIAKAFYKQDYYISSECFIEEKDVALVKGHISSQAYNIGKTFEGTNGY